MQILHAELFGEKICCAPKSHHSACESDRVRQYRQAHLLQTRSLHTQDGKSCGGTLARAARRLATGPAGCAPAAASDRNPPDTRGPPVACLRIAIDKRASERAGGLAGELLKRLLRRLFSACSRLHRTAGGRRQRRRTLRKTHSRKLHP